MPSDLNIDQAAIFCPMLPLNRRIVTTISPCAIRLLGEESGHILAGTNVPDGHVQKFIPRVSVMLNGRIVHVEKGQRLRIKDPHRLRVVLEQDAVLFFRTRSLRTLHGIVVSQGGAFESITTTVLV